MGSSIVQPTPEQLALLKPFERFSFRVTDFVNSHGPTKQASALFLHRVGMPWVHYCTRNLVHLVGLERVHGFKPARGMILASNHRSFFDQYVISCYLMRTTDLLEHLYFPVKSDFWYSAPAGLFISLIMSAFAMYPPVLRDPRRRDFNFYGLRRMAQLLEQPGTVVGLHPEGTRNKGEDPYALLPAQPGIGKLIMEARPAVVPIFINGLCNDFRTQVRSNFDGTGRPVIIVFGQPLDLSTFFVCRNRLRTQKEVADHVLVAIRELGEEERRYRQELGEHPAPGAVVRG